MTKFRILAVCLAVLAALSFLVSGVLASSQTIEIPDWENAVRFEVLTSQEPVRPGDSFELALVATITPGYHIYGPKEPKPSGTMVAIEGDTLKAGAPVYPAVIRRDLSGLGEFDLYEGTIAIRLPAALPKTYTESQVAASVKASYQICTDFACSAPVSDVFEIEIPCAKPGTSVTKLRPDVFSTKK